MFKTESTLGLIGSILGTVSTVFSLIACVFVSVFFNVSKFSLGNVFERFDWNFDVFGILSRFAGAFVVLIIIGVLLGIASIILGYIGTFKLKRNDKSGGILLIIAGTLAFVSLCVGGVFGTVPMILFFIGGIMTVSKKDRNMA